LEEVEHFVYITLFFLNIIL